MKPYYQDDFVTIYHGDCLLVLPYLNNKFDLILTDPPYNASGNKNNFSEKGYSTIDELWDYDFVPDFIYPSVSLLRDGGSTLVFCSYHMIHIYLAMNKPQQIIHWVKENPFPAINKVYTPSVEYICWWTKGSPYTFNRSGKTDVMYSPICGGHERTEHPTQKPLSIISRLIETHSNVGDIILDPFMGSGTTLRAAKDLGRKAIGIEIEEKYCEIAAKRMAQEAFTFK